MIQRAVGDILKENKNKTLSEKVNLKIMITLIVTSMKKNCVG